MTLLKILKVENVEGDYSFLAKHPNSSPENYAYGIFSEVDGESEIGKFARLRQESPLFSLSSQMGSYIKNHQLEKQVVAVLNKNDKDYISGDKVHFLSKDETKLFSAKIESLVYPQYGIMKRFNENLKQE
jgi:hypothetical protein